MLPKSFFFVWALSTIITCNGAPAGKPTTKTHQQLVRNTRSFPFPFELYDPFADFWSTNSNNLLLSALENPSSIDDIFHLETLSPTISREHITPDFSNGLEYPDPLLLRGNAARLAVRQLYKKELFFEEIPHVRAITYNQRQRRENGLPANVLGSLRPTWPFSRFAPRFRF